MGTSSLQHSDTPQLRPGKKLSFSLPSFRKPSGERQAETNAEERARVRKAAAWQWYTRGMGEVVAPTKASRPAAAPPAANSPAVQVGDKSVRGEASNNKQQQQMPLESQPQIRAASRFQAQASVPRPAKIPSSIAGAASSPLYDEFELSSLRTHMAAFVQRLQTKQQKAPQDELRPAAAYNGGDQKTAAAQGGGGLSAAGAPSATAFHTRPLTALHRFFRRVISGSKNTRNSPSIITTEPSPTVQEPLARPQLDDKEDSQYHYHHYIHHHHHHYHYGNSSEDGASVIGRRRHSESSGIRPAQIPSPWEEVEEDYGEGEGEVEESPIQAYLARRRRYSDSFADHIMNVPAQKAVSDDIEGEGHPYMKPVRRYNSERFMSSTPNKIPGEGHAGSKLGSKGTAIDEGLMLQSTYTDVRSRRRHSAEILRDGSSLGEGRAATGAGGKTEGGAKYKLGGARPGGAAATQVARRRHSEAAYRRLEMNDQYDMGMRANRTPALIACK